MYKDLSQPFYLLFSDCSVSPLFIFSCASVCYFSFVVFFYGFLHFFIFFYVSYFSSGFLFCGYHAVCMKCLIDKILLFLLIAFYLHSPIQILSVPPSFLCFVVTNCPFLYLHSLPKAVTTVIFNACIPLTLMS